jgi:hypothetical protein
MVDPVITPTAVIYALALAFGRGGATQAGTLTVKKVISLATRDADGVAAFASAAVDSIIAVHRQRPKNGSKPRKRTLKKVLSQRLAQTVVPVDQGSENTISNVSVSDRVHQIEHELASDWMAPAALWLATALFEPERGERMFEPAGAPKVENQSEWREWVGDVIEQLRHRVVHDQQLRSLREHLYFLHERLHARAGVAPVREIAHTLSPLPPRIAMGVMALTIMAGAAVSTVTLGIVERGSLRPWLALVAGITTVVIIGFPRAISLLRDLIQVERVRRLKKRMIGALRCNESTQGTQVVIIAEFRRWLSEAKERTKDQLPDFLAVFFPGTAAEASSIAEQMERPAPPNNAPVTTRTDHGTKAVEPVI